MFTRVLLRAVKALAVALAANAAQAANIQLFTPQGEVAKIRQARATFSEAMVRFGDPRLPSPFDVGCANDAPVTETRQQSLGRRVRRFAETAGVAFFDFAA